MTEHTDRQRNRLKIIGVVALVLSTAAITFFIYQQQKNQISLADDERSSTTEVQPSVADDEKTFAALASIYTELKSLDDQITKDFAATKGKLSNTWRDQGGRFAASFNEVTSRLEKIDAMALSEDSDAGKLHALVNSYSMSLRIKYREMNGELMKNEGANFSIFEKEALNFRNKIEVLLAPKSPESAGE